MQPVILLPEGRAEDPGMVPSSVGLNQRTPVDVVPFRTQRLVPHYRRAMVRRVRIPIGAWIAVSVTLAIVAAFAILLA